MSNRSTRFILVLLCTCALAAAHLGGCGSDDDTTGPVDTTPVSPYPDDALGLLAADQKVLDQAGARYDELLLTLTPAAARLALIDELTDTAHITSATLADGGYLISISFSSGAFALLNTEELLNSAPDGGKAGDAPVARATPIELKLHRLADKAACGDVVTPPSRKVVIIAPIFVSSGYTDGMINRIYSELKDMGWEPDDIDFRYPEEVGDVAGLLPHDMLDIEGYGMALYIAHGGSGMEADGQEHFWIEGGQVGTLTGVVPDSLVSTYIQWQKDGLISGGNTRSDDGYIKEIYMKDTLFSSQMKMDEGAGVFFVTCNSDKLSDEMVSAGAGAVFSWDGRTRMDSGEESFIALMKELSDPQGAASGTEALQAIEDQGLGGSPYDTHLIADGDASKFHLPVFPMLNAPADCLPTGTDHVEVTLSFADCPELNITVSIFPDGTLNLPAMPPVPVDIEMRAVDATGNTLGAGLFGKDLGGADQDIDLCPCDGAINLNLTDYPADGPYAATKVHVDLVYDDATLGVESFDLTLPLTGISNLVPGGSSSDITVLSAGNDVLSVASRDVEIRCDATPTVSLCVGWLELELGDYPADTHHVTVTAADAFPESVDLGPGDVAGLYGFAMGDVVTLNGEAFNAVGVSLGTTTASATIACGATRVTISFQDYGIIVETDRYLVDRDGVDFATITATARRYRSEDGAEPTGDSVPGVLVDFDTSVGFFLGAASGYTDAGGTMTVQVASMDFGVAAVRGFNLADNVEGVRPAYVNFGRVIGMTLDSNADKCLVGGDKSIWVEFRCAAYSLVRDGWEMMSGDCGSGAVGWRFETDLIGSVGNSFTISLSPCYPCLVGGDPTDPFVGPAYVHYYYYPYLENQITVEITPGQNPLTGVLSTFVLEDPGAP